MKLKSGAAGNADFNWEALSDAFVRSWQDDTVLSSIRKRQAKTPPLLTEAAKHAIAIRVLQESLRSIPKPYADVLWHAYGGLTTAPSLRTFAETYSIDFGSVRMSFAVDSPNEITPDMFLGNVKQVLHPNNLFSIYVQVKRSGIDTRR